MKKIFCCIFTLITISLFSNNIYFFNDISVKNSGVSGALSCFSNDGFSPFVNPAGLSELERQELNFTYINLFGLSTLSAGSFSYPIYERGSFAISGVILSTGDIEERDEFNQITGNFSDVYKVLNISYGIKIIDFLSIGTNLKYIHHNFYKITSSSYCMDLGTILYLPFDVRAAVIGFNLVKPVFEYSSFSKDVLPFEIKISFGKEFILFKEFKDKLKIGIGINIEEYENIKEYFLGCEYYFLNLFFIRGGIKNQDVSFGASFKISDFIIDYAAIKMPLDFSHRLGFSISFGENIRKLEAETKTKEEKIKQELITKIKIETTEKYKKEIKELLQKQDYENAKIVVEKALVWAPDDLWFKDSEKEINQLLEQKKIKDLFTEADELLKQDLYIDAMVRLKAILEIDPNNKLAQNKFKLAEEYVKSLGEKNYVEEEKNKEMIRKSFEKGLKLYTEQKYEDAINEWDKIIRASPFQRQVYNYIKAAQEKIQKKKELKQTEQILKRQKISELYNKAVLEYTKGNFTESLNYWHELLKIDPENKEAKEYIEKIVEDYKKIQKQEMGW